MQIASFGAGNVGGSLVKTGNGSAISSSMARSIPMTRGTAETWPRRTLGHDVTNNKEISFDR